MIVFEKVELLKSISTAHLRQEFESYMTLKSRTVSDDIARELIAIELDRRQSEDPNEV